MTAGERRLGKALLFSCIASAAALGFFFGTERIVEARARIGDYRRSIARLSNLPIDEAEARARLQVIAGLIDKAENRASAASMTSISAFGQRAMRLLRAHGIVPDRYQVVSGAKGELLEFSVKCGAGDLLRFIRRATEGEGWAIPYLSLHLNSADGSAEAAIRLAR